MGELLFQMEKIFFQIEQVYFQSGKKKIQFFQVQNYKGTMKFQMRAILGGWKKIGNLSWANIMIFHNKARVHPVSKITIIFTGNRGWMQKYQG